MTPELRVVRALDELRDGLAEVMAERERREPRQQAAYIIEQALRREEQRSEPERPGVAV